MKSQNETKISLKGSVLWGVRYALMGLLVTLASGCQNSIKGILFKMNDTFPHSFTFPEKLNLDTIGLKHTNYADLGSYSLSGVQLIAEGDGALQLNRAWSYSFGFNSLVPQLKYEEVRKMQFDESKHLLYVATRYNITVIDTHGSTDPTQHTILTEYNTSGTLVTICDRAINDMFLDKNLGILYVALAGCGFRAIDTKNNKDPSDDVLLTTFSEFTIPAVGAITGWAYSVYLDPVSKYLHMGTSGQGLLAIDTKGTNDKSQWVYAGRYATATTPAIAHNWSLQTYRIGNFLYVSGSTGLYVIDTKGTNILTDDTIATHYTTSTTPALANDWTPFSFVDADNNVLYVGGVNVVGIDTKGTTTIADDVEIVRYGSGTGTGSLLPKFSYALSGFFDSSSKNIYLSTRSGAFVVDTKGTTAASDDTLKNSYSQHTTPAIQPSEVSSMLLDSSTSTLFICGSPGLSAVNPDLNLFNGTALSPLVSLENSTPKSIRWTTEAAYSSSISNQYRMADYTTIKQMDFDDGVASEYAGDLLGFGSPFATSSESGGTLKLSVPSNPYTYSGGQSVYFWLTSGLTPGTAKPGAKVTARVRVNSNRTTHPAINGAVYLLIYESNALSSSEENATAVVNNQWAEISVQLSGQSAAAIGFNVNWATGTWNSGADSFEIDWIKVENPIWDSWSTACSTSSGCEISATDRVNKDLIQYRFNFTSNNSGELPGLTGIEVFEAYSSSKTITSEVLTIPVGAKIYAIAADILLPANTSATYSYSLDSGANWLPLQIPFRFSDGLVADSFQWRATLQTTDANFSPDIRNIQVALSDPHLTYGPDVTPKPVEVSTNKWAFVMPGTYNYKIPSGYTSAEIYVLGGGGAGGGTPLMGKSATASGGGGGGGGYYIASMAVTAGEEFQVTVGIGGVPHLFGRSTDGESSSFGSVASATGGKGGEFSTGTGAGGAGGTGTGTGGVSSTGGNGGSGGNLWYGGTGGGAACPNQNGGNGLVTGSGYGPGGGGAGFLTTGSPSTGGVGSGSGPGVGGCGGGNGGTGSSAQIESTNATSASTGRGIQIDGNALQGGGGFGGGGGGSWTGASGNNGGAGGSGLVWIKLIP